MFYVTQHCYAEDEQNYVYAEEAYTEEKVAQLLRTIAVEEQSLLED